MIECTVDTHIVADIFKQYSSAHPNLLLNESNFLTGKIHKFVNECIESNGSESVVITSSFAIVEIVNQFKKISNSEFDIAKLIGILQQPPEWLIIEPFNHETAYYLISVPKYIGYHSIELTDAIHVATALQRGPNTFLATYDGILKKINYKSLNLNLLLP